MSMNICKNSVVTKTVRQVSVKKYNYIFFKIKYMNAETFAIYIGDGEMGDFAMLGTDEKRASRNFERAFTYELSPIHLQDFAHDCMNEMAEFAKKL